MLENLHWRRSMKPGATIALLSCCALSACSVFDPSLLDRADVGPDIQSEADVPTAPDIPDVPFTPDANDQCNGMGYQIPPRPDGANDGDMSMILGLHQLLLNQDGDRWQDIGRNLDGLCSDPPVPEVECQPREEGAMPEIDGNGGIDNVFGGSFFSTVGIVTPELNETAVSGAENGTGVVVLLIDGYNGELDDPRVQVGVIQSVYGFAGSAGDTEPPAHDIIDFDPFMPGTMDPMTPPMWDGNDWLFPRDDSYAADGSPRVLTIDAYVSGGVLVVDLEDNVPFLFASSVIGLRVQLTDAMIIAKLHPSLPDAGEVQLSGRWKIVELLAAARTLGICDGTTNYTILTRALDRVADVLAAPSELNDLECDALSVGVQWISTPVRLAEPTPAPLPPDGCM